MELSSAILKVAPHASLVFIQFVSGSYIFLSKVILVQGISATAFLTYQFFVATLSLALLAFIFERNKIPPITMRILLEIFLMALFGMTILQIMFMTALYYVPSTIESSALNLVPAVTYLICVVIKQEKLRLDTSWGSGKMIGTLISVSGAFCLFFWHKSGGDVTLADATNWTIGLILLAAAVLVNSIWTILLGAMARRFPAEMSFTAIMSFFGTIQTGVVAVVMNHNPSQWRLDWSLELLNIVIGGMLATGLAIFVVTWCAGIKGPVFATSFSPLGVFFNAILEVLFLGHGMNFGSVFGSILIVLGLYTFLWSKSKEEDVEHKLDANSETAVPLLG